MDSHDQPIFTVFWDYDTCVGCSATSPYGNITCNINRHYKAKSGVQPVEQKVIGDKEYII